MRERTSTPRRRDVFATFFLVFVPVIALVFFFFFEGGYSIVSYGAGEGEGV